MTVQANRRARVSNQIATRIDIAANRRAGKWSRKEQIGRLLWGLVQPLFRFSPRPLWGWRRFLLRAFGARIGREVHIHPTVRVAIPWNLEIGDWSAVGFDVLIYDLGPVRLGQRVTISQRAHLCAGSHDFRDPAMPLLKPPIAVDDDAWICADAFIGPGVEIGAGAVVGACGVVVKDVAAWAIVAGNPAREIAKRELRD
jgi:putative colanic acid biosynthesis acetyltransferase WcaF